MIVRSRANQILNSLFPNTEKEGYTYIGLSTTTPTETGSNFTEPTAANGYKRRKLDVMGAASDGQISNTDIIFFPETTNNGWGNVTHFGLFSSLTGGTPYLFGALNENVNLPSGYVPIFRTKALIVGLDKDSLDV